MEIKFASILVNDQERALRFYTEKLGFVKKNDLPDGSYRWLTIASKEAENGVELVLEGLDFPHLSAFQKAQFKAGIPSLTLYTKDVHGDYRRLRRAGVVFRGIPENMGPNIGVPFEDTCGNILVLVQPGR
jgi:catechol 2,3-dioxygenase-like lactoylglutathione lyase family enzyme